MCKEAWENPGVSILYIALTRESAERIMVKDVLKVINRDMRLGCKFQDQKLTMTFPNGSIIYLVGADAYEDQMNRLLGQKYKLVFLDEASKYRINVQHMIFDVLKPAVADYEGTIAMIGTSTNYINSYFANVTRGKISGWNTYKWSATDNPHMKRQFDAEIEQLKLANPEVEHEAWFRQNYLGEWVVDTRSLIYQYDEGNLITELPSLSFTYTLGIVLSYSGYSAFTVCAYSPKAREAFIVEAYKIESTDLYRAVEEAMRLQDRYTFSAIVCADVSKKLTQEIRERFPLSVEDSLDKDKPALMRVFISELKQNNIKVLDGNTDIVNEWDSILKDEKSRKDLREHPLCPNYVATSALYAWTKCFNHHYLEEAISDDPNDRYWEEKAETINNPEEDDLDSFFN
jgi:hypothetical protein